MSGRRLLQVGLRDRRPVGFGREADERGELPAREVKGSFSSCLGSCSGACRPGVAKSCLEHCNVFSSTLFARRSLRTTYGLLNITLAGSCVEMP